MKKESHWLNKTNMAKSLGISPQAFTAWGVEPVAKIGRENFYLVTEVLANRETYWIGQNGISPDSDAEDRKTAYQLARIRLTNEQADALALKNEISKHEVAPFEFLTFVVGRVANVLAGVMDAMPVECMRQLNLTVPEVEKVKAIVAVSSESITNLGDEAWMDSAFNEFLKEEGYD